MKKSLRSSLKNRLLRLMRLRKEAFHSPVRGNAASMRGCVRCKTSILYKSKPAPSPLSHPALALRLR